VLGNPESFRRGLGAPWNGVADGSQDQFVLQVADGKVLQGATDRDGTRADKTEPQGFRHGGPPVILNRKDAKKPTIEIILNHGETEKNKQPRTKTTLVNSKS
jgi:hypothetical protein